MKIAIGSDHRGVDFRHKIADELKGLNVDVVDMGTDGPESVDYPDFSAKVSRAVARDEVDRGIVVCGTGIGAAMAANKIRGIRAALVHDVFTAERSRRHNDANVLCLGAEIVKEQALGGILKAWLTTEFEGGRHQRRVDKIDALQAEEQ